MLDPRLLKILVCSQCKGDLEYDQEKSELICHQCRLIFAVEHAGEHDIPNMLIDQAKRF